MIDEFRAVFPSPQLAKIIHDLIRLGYIERISRGSYKVNPPKKFVESIVEDNLKQRSVLRDVAKKYAYTDSDAVRIWTEGILLNRLYSRLQADAHQSLG
jgi:hypothetical protein